MNNQIKVIFFDMDGTLYKSTAIRDKFAEAAYVTLAKFQEISTDKAKELVESKRTRLKEEYGTSVPYTLTLKSFGIPIEYWHKENIAYFDPREFLREDIKLKATLSELEQCFYLAVLTNNNETQTVRTLKALGIKEYFINIFTYNSFKLLKPDPEFLKKAMQAVNARADQCCVIGDRYAVDLQPAEQLGMKVKEVNGPEDLYGLDKDLIKKGD